MRLCAPVVLVDEAHNVRTPLSFQTLAHLQPSCILELTATPEQRRDRTHIPSNVLVSVHTGQLKAENMVKLPILLSVHPESWKQALNAALKQQQGLKQLAAGDQDYVYPLVLIQAQNTNGEANVAAVKAFLVEEGLPEAAIKIATGDQRELDGLDLFDPASKIEAVITMEALREGWDCSFAYVFCSLRNVTSATAVKQLLGRVLRMPYARRRLISELNQAYAHVLSQDFAATAATLKDRLVEKLGFTPEESQDYLVPKPPETNANLFAKTIEVMQRPGFSDLPIEQQEAVRVRQATDGRWSVELRDEVPVTLDARILSVVPPPEQSQAIIRIALHNGEVQAARAVFTPRQSFSVPQLYVTVDNQPHLFTPELAGEETPLQLSDFELNLDDFNYSPTDQRFAIDFRSGQMEVRPLQRNASFTFAAQADHTALDLSRWLNREIHTIALTYAEAGALINNVVSRLQSEQGVPLDKLWEAKFALARWLKDTIEATQASVHARGYQHMLERAFTPEADEFAFRFLPNRYYPDRLYSGGLSFSRHFYFQVGYMNSPEANCAHILDSLEGVEVWVRNIERDRQYSFKLPTITDFYYPDFVAKLTDGRVLVVEYKGELRVGEDADEKRTLGHLWAARSNSRGVFAWVESHEQTGRSIEHQLQSAIQA